jgi:hypothetical protein
MREMPFNKSLRPASVGRLSSAFAVDITGPAWLSFGLGLAPVGEIQTNIEEITDSERRFIVQSLIGYNDSKAAQENYRDLSPNQR